MENKVYLCIDLKSFYASVECVERKLDPLTTNLVVADNSRTEKTICLAVTPSLKSYGISGRARLFEVIQSVKQINYERKRKCGKFRGKSYNFNELTSNDYLELDYITAVPRMALYIEYSSRIYDVYLKYIAPEDIHVYSIDEVFMDITHYLKSYELTPHELAMKIIKDVLKETGITATAGIGTNMFLSKVAMDIVAKKMPADEDGVRIAELDEMSFRTHLWDHLPLTDFWRIGPGITRRLNQIGIRTMGDIALCSIKDENILYDLFGINAELIIDHAWGYEPTTIAHIKNYKPVGKSLGVGQVLHEPYDYEHGRLIVKEMIDGLSLDLVDKGITTNQLVLTIGYDIMNLSNPEIAKKYEGEVTIDFYGRLIPKHAHGTVNIRRYTASTRILTNAIIALYDSIVNPNLLIRRVNIAATRLRDDTTKDQIKYQQLDLFSSPEELDQMLLKEDEQIEKERRSQKAILELKKKFGKNAVMKGMNYQDKATMKDRNEQIGGHKA